MWLGEIGEWNTVLVVVLLVVAPGKEQWQGSCGQVSLRDRCPRRARSTRSGSPSGFAESAGVGGVPRFSRNPPDRLGRTEAKPGGSIATVSRDPCVSGRSGGGESGK